MHLKFKIVGNVLILSFFLFFLSQFFILQIIPNITRKYHDGMVKCEVHNAVGKSEESEALDISCKYCLIPAVSIFIKQKHKSSSRQIKFCVNLNGIFIDGPVFKARPKSIEADNGATITLVCDVVGNPPPDMLWIHEPNDKVSVRKIFG